MTLHAEIPPLMTQGAAPQPNAVGIVPASGGQSDLFALLLGMTLTSSQNSTADPAGALADNTSGTLAQVPVWGFHIETGTQPEALEPGAVVDTMVLPDGPPVVADPLIGTLLLSLPPSVVSADEEAIPDPIPLQPRLPSGARLTPRLQASPLPVATTDLSHGAVPDTDATAATKPDAPPVTAPLAARISTLATAQLSTPSTSHTAQPVPEWAPLSSSGFEAAIALDAATETGHRGMADPRLTAHNIETSFLIAEPRADISESALRVAGRQNQVPGDPLRIIAPPFPGTPAGFEFTDMLDAPAARAVARPMIAAASPTWSAVTPEIHTSVAVTHVDPSAAPTTAPVAPIVQLAAQLGLSDGFALEVGESTAAPVLPAPQTGTVTVNMPADLNPRPMIPLPATASAVVTGDAPSETVPTLPVAEIVPTLDAAEGDGREARPSIPAAPDDENHLAAQRQPVRHTDARVRVDATPARMRVTESQQQIRTGDTQQPDRDITPATPNRNSAVRPAPLPDAAPVPAVPGPGRPRMTVRATVPNGSAPESPTLSHIAASTPVRPDEPKPVVRFDDTARPAPGTPSQAPAPVAPNTTAATQVQTVGQDVMPTMSRTEPVVPMQMISQTTNTIASPEPVTQVETPEPARFVIETPRPLPVPGRIAVRLEPPELGAIRIDLTARPQGVVGRMRFESEPTRLAVERSFPELHKALADAGVRVERFEITGHTPGRELVTVWVAEDTGQNPLADRAPHGRPWANATGDPRERPAPDDDRRRPPKAPTGSTRTGGFPALRVGQVNLLA